MRATGLSRREFALGALAAVGAGRKPQPVKNFLEDLAIDMTQRDSRLFLDNFDSKMPGYNKLARYIPLLLIDEGVGSSVEIVKDAGEESRRDIEIDWILEFPDGKRRQATVNCSIEWRKKRWVVTRLEPVDFFAPPQL